VISCGSLGFGDVESAAHAVLDAGTSTLAVVVCGRNEDLRHHLVGEGDHGGRLRALGWTDRMPGLTRASDVVVTNAGGATSLEALACGRTVLMYRPIAAHGKANARLMAEAGLAEVCDDQPQLGAAIRRLHDDPATLLARERSALAYAQRRTLADGLRELLRVAGEARSAHHPARPTTHNAPA
ncbi:MAG: glycosyltransferase, partial [Candidatus Dormiibacterota bacterium]